MWTGWQEEAHAERMKRLRVEVAQKAKLRAASPIRARCDQADMADTPLFGQGSML